MHQKVSKDVNRHQKVSKDIKSQQNTAKDIKRLQKTFKNQRTHPDCALVNKRIVVGIKY